jgi:lipopolysaccharide heptosyltransferase II
LNILLVRLRLVGDVVFTTPLLRALRRAHPSARLTYLVETAAAPVVSGNPHLSDVITVPRSRGWRRVRDDLRLAALLRRRRFDVAIDLHGGPRSAWLTLATRAPVRVGYDVPGRAWMYTRVVPRAREFRPRHSVENQWDLLAAVGPIYGAAADPDRDRVEMAVEEPARASVDRRLVALGVTAAHRLIVVHVSAGNPFRRWPESAFADLAADLVARHDDRWVLLTGGPSDHAAATRVMAMARARTGVAADRIVDAEGFTLPDLRALMDRAALFVGGDSGPLHIASTSDVPIVGLYGPTLVERSAPWRPRDLPTASVFVDGLPCRPCDQRVCAPGDYRCLTGVPAETVHEAAERILEATR